MRDQVWVVTHRAALLLYTIRNITEQPPPETQFGTTPTSDLATPTSDQAIPTSDQATPTSTEYKLGYEVCVDKKAWSLQDPGAGQGVLDVPGPQLASTLQFTIVPSGSGSFPMPRLLLKWVPMNSGGVAKEESAGVGCVLTDAQVYELSRGQLVTVHSSSSVGR